MTIVCGLAEPKECQHTGCGKTYVHVILPFSKLDENIPVSPVLGVGSRRLFLVGDAAFHESITSTIPVRGFKLQARTSALNWSRGRGGRKGGGREEGGREGGEGRGGEGKGGEGRGREGRGGEGRGGEGYQMKEPIAVYLLTMFGESENPTATHPSASPSR